MKIIYTENNRSLTIRSDFNEITNLSIINQLKEKLQNHNFVIRIYHEGITTEANFIRKFVTQINKLNVDADYNGNFTTIDMVDITKALSTSNIKVCFVGNFV